MGGLVGGDVGRVLSQAPLLHLLCPPLWSVLRLAAVHRASYRRDRVLRRYRRGDLGGRLCQAPLAVQEHLFERIDEVGDEMEPIGDLDSLRRAPCGSSCAN